MNLTHDQKKYIKRHIRDQSLDQIAYYLKADENTLAEYIKKRWGEDKFEAISANQENLEPKVQPAPSTKWYSKTWVHILLIISLIFIAYTNSLNNAFVSDDIAEIRDNPNIGNLATITSRPFGFIRLIIYWLSYHVGGLNPFAFRMTNFLFHIGSSLLVYFILLKLSNFKKIAIITSLLFAVHPAISEAVVWISGGMYTQYTFFFLLSFLFYILSKNNLKYYLLSIFCYSLSFMSHGVMPAGLAIVFLIYEFIFGNFKKNWPKSIPFILILIVYVFINLSGLSERETTLQNVHYQEKGIDNIFLLIPVAISSYFELLFWPKILTLYHSELFLNTFNFILRAVITIIFFLILLFGLFKKRVIFFWLSFFFLALSPTLTPFRLNWIVAERYIYLPSIGIFAALAFGLDKLTKYRKKMAIVFYLIFAVIIIALLSRTILRNIDWKSEDNLWIATGKTSPSSPNTHNNLGDVYGRWGDKKRSMEEFQKAIQLKPNYADAYHNLANVYLEIGNQEKAVENYQNAIKFNPHLWQSYQNIAAIYFQQQKYDQALEYIQKAISINPKNTTIRNNLGLVYLTLGDKQKAKNVFTQVLILDPQNQIAKQGLAETNK